MKIAATVILYYPDESINSNISTYLPFVDFVLLFDNSPHDTIKKILFNNPKIRYSWEGENRGISYRINQSIEVCKNEKVEYLLTMDQDSSFNQDEFVKYLRIIESTDNKNEIGMYGINPYRQSFTIIENEILITSGSVLNIQIADKVGKFDENLFIDDVDYEFCLRLFINNFKTLRIGEIHFNHQFGEIKRILSPRLHYQYISIYNPTRIYYITRNYFYVNKLYKGKIKMNEKRLQGVMNRIKYSLLYSNTFKTILYVIKGYLDFKFEKMGKIKLY
jgi:rhamnosyltransferase